MTQPKIFVTGGTGFVGAYLLRYLVQKGYTEVRALRRPTSKMDLVESVQDQIEWVEGDILNLPFLEEVLVGIDQVYHCAAMISFVPSEADRMLQVNETGTENIVNTSLLLGVKKLVHLSSIAAIGREQYGKAISENTKWQTEKLNSNYAKSKYAAEMQVWRGIAEGLNAAILNPSVILGSGFWESGSTEIFNLYGKGFPFYSDGVNGFVDVRDVAKLAILLMNSDITAERFLVSAENLSFQKVFNLISAKAGVKAPYFKINTLLSGISWRLIWVLSKITGKAPSITKETVQSALGIHHYDNQKSIATFNYTYTPIEQTIDETVAQFLAAQKESGKARVLPLN